MSLALWQMVDSSVKPENLGAFQYKELRETGKGQYSPGASSANRVFIVAWIHHVQFLDDLLGYSYLDGANAVRRVLPDQHPIARQFWAMDATVETMGPASRTVGGTPLFTLAKVTATYKPTDYAILEDFQVANELGRFVTRQYSFAQEYLSLQGNMRWVTRPNKDALSAVAGKTIGTMELVYTWHEVPSILAQPFKVPNLSAIKNSLGKVNNDVFDTDYQAGTLLFLGAAPRMVTPRLADPVYYWEIEMRFLLRDNGAGVGADPAAGHNYVYDPPNSRWDLVTTDGTEGGGRIYESADFATLFTVTG